MSETVQVTSQGPYCQGEPVEIQTVLSRAGVPMTPTVVYLVVDGEDGSTIANYTAGVGSFTIPTAGTYLATVSTWSLAGKYTWAMYSPPGDAVEFAVQGSFYVTAQPLRHV